jgi:5-methylcytosine-specific restriction endonuclease McrA
MPYNILYNEKMTKLKLESKLCKNCGLIKPRAEYYKKSDTISTFCKPCTLERNRLLAPKYFGKYREYQNQWRNKKYSEDLEFKTKHQTSKKLSYDKNQSKINASRRQRWKDDPYNPAKLHHRRKDVKGRTPSWVNKAELLEVYAKCPKGFHVDHIIPLKGLIDLRPVSGLHVPWNLQYLTPEQNLKKHNRITESELLLLI